MDIAAADVFLSYSRTDAEAVRRVQVHLQAAGLATFLDRDQLAAGQPWLPALEQAIAHCGAVAIFVGPTGLGTWQQREVQLALDRQAEAERTGRPFPVVPVLLPKVEDPPGGFLKLQTWVDLRADLADPVQLQLLLTGIRGLAPADGSTLREAFCPYRGLLPFREEDVGLFFGRKDAIDTLLDKLREHALVTLVGRSGSGKSSVVYAGLIPALRRRADGRTWSILSLRPGPEPLHALVRLFDPLPPDLPPFEADDRVEQQVEILRRTDGALSRRIRSLLATEGERGTDRLLLHVDQWEELYTQALHQSVLTPEQAEADVACFIDLLLDATHTSPCTVVLTVRADFYGEFLKHDRLTAAVPPGQVNLGPMRREDLTAAIQEPAKAVGLSVDPPLLEVLLDEVCNDLGKLPLLEYALKETWRGREGTRLTLNAYGQAGGIDGAVAKRANDIYTHLRPAEQAAARRLFVSLVTPGEGREDTRARAVYPAQDDDISAVVHAFSAAEARLLVTGEDTPSAQRLVEISHEALIREWDLLKAWIDDNRQTLRRREHIRARMRQWEEQDKDESLLLPPGLPLEEGRKLLADHGDVLTEEVQPYITASIAADEERLRREEAEAEAEQQRELAAAHRLVSEQRKRTRVSIGFSLLALLLAIVAIWQWRIASEQRAEADVKRKDAERQVRITTAQRLAAQAQALGEGYPERRILLAVEAMKATSSDGDHIPAAEEALREALAATSGYRLSGHEDEISSVAISADGHWLVTGSFDQTARLWDLTAADPATSSRVLRGHEEGITSVAISADNHWLVTGSADKTARLWDLTAADPATSSRVLRGKEDEIARLLPWGLRQRRVQLRGHEDWIDSVAISADGHWLVTGSWSSDPTAWLWDLTAADPATSSRVLRGHEKGISGRISFVAISADNHWLVTRSEYRAPRLWDLTAADPATSSRVLRGHEKGISGRISFVAISADNHWLVTGSSDQTVRLWDLTAADPATSSRVLRGHEGGITSVAISADGHWLVTMTLSFGGSDGTARLWDLTAADPTTSSWVLRGHEDDLGISSVAISADNHWLVTMSRGLYRARLWDLTAADPTTSSRVLWGHEDKIESVAISADGHWLVTRSADKTARLWDLTAADPATSSRVLRGRYESYSVAISADSHWLVTGGDRKLRLWDLTAADPTTSSRVLRGHEGWIHSIAISADSRWLVTRSGGSDPTAWLWDLTAADPATSSRVLRGHEEEIHSIAISADSRWLVTSGRWEHTVRLWDLTAADPTTSSQVLRGHEDKIISEAISADSHWLVTGSKDKTARLWTLQRDELLDQARAVAGRNLRVQEWEQYFGEKPYDKTFPEYPHGSKY